MRALHVLNCTLLAGIALAGALFAAGPAGGQAVIDADTTVLVCATDNPSYSYLMHLYSTVYSNTATALDDAVNAVKNSNTLTTVLVAATVDADGDAVSTVWTGTISLAGNEKVKIVGFPREHPEAVQLQPANIVNGVVEVSGNASISIEGVTLSAGVNGLRGTGNASITLDRCYITGNTGSGVLCEGSASLTMSNCSVAANGGDGVRLDTTSDSTIDHCSILQNTGSGVVTLNDSPVTVTNSMIYENQGGGSGFSDSEDMEPRPDGWTIVPDSASPAIIPGSHWQWGPPQGNGGVFFPEPDPLTGAPDVNTGTLGVNVFGVNLAGDYEATQTYNANLGVALPIDPGSSVIWTFTPPLSGAPYPIGDVNVNIDLDHPRLEDLKLTLTSPAGTAVELVPQGAMGPGGGLVDVELNDEAGAVISGTSTVGVFRPVNPLGVLDNQDAAGAWTLAVEDTNAAGASCDLLDETFGADPPPGWAGNGWHADGGTYQVNVTSPMPLKDSLAWYNDPAGLGWTDYTYTCDFEVPPTPAVDYEYGLAFRVTGPQDYYMLRVRHATPGGPGGLLDEDFEDGVADGWVGPGWMVQNIDGSERYTKPVGAPEPMTVYADANATFGWENYTFESSFYLPAVPAGDAEVGFVFRYQDADNYYVLRAVQRGVATAVELASRIGGVDNPPLLSVPANALIPNRAIPVTITLDRDQVTIVVTLPVGPAITIGPFSGVTLRNGTVGFRSVGTDAAFDDVRVTKRDPGPGIVGTYYSMVSVSSGTETVLLPEVVGPDVAAGSSVLMSAKVQGESITASVGSYTYPAVTDPTHPTGSVGLYSRGAVVRFDNVCVSGPTGARLNDWGLVITPPMTWYYLESKEYVLGAVESVGVQFQEYMNMEANAEAALEASFDSGVTWDPVPGYTSTGDRSTRVWETVGPFDLSSLIPVGSTDVRMRLRWGYRVNEGAVPASGWNIDEVAVSGGADDAGGLVRTGPDLANVSFSESTNYVWENQPRDRVRVLTTAGALFPDPNNPASGTTDPLLAGTPWLGKLVLGSPLTSRGTTGNGYDFEYERRTGVTTIGADELLGAGTVGPWTFCQVTPHPVGPVGAGGLNVFIMLEGTFTPGSGSTNPDMVFVAPQGVKPEEYDLNNTSAPIIRLQVDWQAGGILSCSNIDPIQTFLTGGAGDPSSILADGHAAVYLRWNGDVIGDDASDQITGQATTGRHFLIDTIPPEVVVADSSGNPLNISDFVFNNSGTPSSFGNVLGNAYHPYPPLAGNDPRVFALSAPSFTMAPTDGWLDPADPQDLHVFLNPSSISNGFPHPGLSVAVTITFEDPSVYDAMGLREVGRPDAMDEDRFSTAPGFERYERQVAGFWPSGSANSTDSSLLSGSGTFTPSVAGITSAPVPARWTDMDGMASISSLPTHLAVNGETRDWSQGYFSSGGLGYGAMVSNWYFGDLLGMAYTIPFTAVGDGIDWAGRFVASDRAGNAGPSAPDRQGPRLHLWWMRQGDTDLGPSAIWAENAEYPMVSWASSRAPKVAYGPAPIYSYGIFMSETEEKNGIYNRVGDFYPWGGTREITPEMFDAINRTLTGTSLAGHWVLVLIGCMDEAGNVTPIRDNGTGVPELDVSGTLLTVLTANPEAESGPNWIRFFVPTDAGSWDTSITGRLGYDNDEDDIPGELGPVRLVSYPDNHGYRVEAVFDIGLVKDPEKKNTGVRIELEQDGRLVYAGWIYSSMEYDAVEQEHITLRLPHDIVNPPAGLRIEPDPDVEFGLFQPPGNPPAQGPCLGRYELRNKSMPFDPDLNPYVGRLTNFVFRAAVGQISSPPYYNIFDPSPAQYSFKVVPGLVENYMEAGSEEPVKTYEIK